MASIPGACNVWAETQAAYWFRSGDEFDWMDILEPHRQCTRGRIAQHPLVLCRKAHHGAALQRSGHCGARSLDLRGAARDVPAPDLRLDAGPRAAGGAGRLDVGTRPGIKESVCRGEGYARVAELAGELPETRLVYVADRESDLRELMVRASDLATPADWLLRSKHNRALPEGGRLWAKVLAGPWWRSASPCPRGADAPPGTYAKSGTPSVSPCRTDGAPCGQPGLGHPGAYGLAGLLRQLKAYRLAGLLLEHACLRQNMIPVGNVLNPQADRIAGLELAVDGQVKEGRLARIAGQLQPGAQGPDLLQLQRRLLPDQLALVPGDTRDGARGCECVHHLSPLWLVRRQKLQPCSVGHSWPRSRQGQSRDPSDRPVKPSWRPLGRGTWSGDNINSASARKEHQHASELSWSEQRLDSQVRTRLTVETLTSKTLGLWILVVTNAAAATAAGGGRALEDALAYDRVTEPGGVSLNRDATHLYATLEPWQGRLEIVRYDLKSGSQAPQALFAPACVDVKAAFPDDQEKRLAFTCDPLGDERHKLHLVDIDTGAYLVPTPRDQLDIPCAFSPDGAVIYAARGHHIWGGTRIVGISTATGEARTRFATDDARLFCHDLSGDGSRLLIERYIDNGERHLGMLDLQDGAIEWLLREHGVQVKQAQFVGEAVHFLANRSGERFGLWSWDRRSGRRPVDLPVSEDIAGFLQNDRGLLALSYRKGLQPVAELYRRRGEADWDAVPLGAGPEEIRTIVLAKNSAERAAILTEHGRPVRLSIFERGQTRLLLDTDQTGLPEGAFARYQSHRVKSFDGTGIPAHILVPSNAAAERPLPLLLLVNGGPDDHQDPVYSSGLQRLANAGFVVVLPNVRGSSGFGKAFQDMDNGDWGGAHIRDLLAVSEFAAGLDFVADRPRFIGGDSFGGFSVLSAIIQYPSAFDGAVDLFGISDIGSFFRGLPDQVRPQLIRELGFDPAREPARAKAMSPLHQVDRIVTPLQIHQGIHDSRVPMEQSRMLVASLRKRAIPVEYFEYDEGHGFTYLESRVLYRERMIRFLSALTDAYPRSPSSDKVTTD